MFFILPLYAAVVIGAGSLSLNLLKGQIPILAKSDDLYTPTGCQVVFVS